MNLSKAAVLAFSLSCAYHCAPSHLWADDSARLVRIDHYVSVKSTAPAMNGKTARIYVREVVQAGVAMRGPVPENRVVLFVHGAGTPAEVAFDVPYQDYSWMALPGKCRFRCIRNGHDRLWPLHPPGAHG